MSVVLPIVRVASVSPPRPVLFSGNQEGSLGGEDLQISRMGDRFAIDFQTSRLQRNADSRVLIAALTEATTADAIVPLPLVNASRSYTQDGVVDGAGQAGSSLKIRSLQPSSTIGRGDFFSVLHNYVRYVFMVRADVTVGGDGKATVPIWPMLRFLTIDGEACEFVQPYLEGRLTGFDGATLSRIHVEPLRFTVTERK